MEGKSAGNLEFFLVWRETERNIDHLGKPKFLFDFVEIESHKSSLLVMAIVDLNTMFFSVYYVFSPVRLQALGRDFWTTLPWGTNISGKELLTGTI